MSLSAKLEMRGAAGRPVRVSLIGAGKFGTMFLSQVPTNPGLETVAIADLDPEKAKAACRMAGWDAERIGRTDFTADGLAACLHEDAEAVIEATGSPSAGIAHALAAIGAGKHTVMVNGDHGARSQGSGSRCRCFA
jgi:predicted homoserine dehydrogenase-like protein